MQTRRVRSGVNASRVLLLPLVSVLDAARTDTDALLAKAGLTRAALQDPALRVPRDLVGDLWRAAVTRTGDPTLGLKVAAAIQPGTLGLIEYAARSGATVGQALTTLTRFGDLLAEGVRFRVSQEGKLARVSYTVTGSPQPPALVDFALGYVVRLMRAFVRPPVPLLEVAFEHPEPADRRPYEEAFQTRLRFGAEQSSVLFDAHYLDATIHTADPHLQAVLEDQAQRLVAELPRSDSFEDRVRRIIADELRTGDASAAGIARKLHMSPRTFQRRLLEAGTTHSALLDDVRHQFATRMLAQQELSMGEIAAALGFFDVSAFRKAFKRWTGRPPKRTDAGSCT